VTTLAAVVTRENVVAWAARNYGPRHAEQRVSEYPAAFVIDTGGVAIVIRKLSGGYWQVGDDPVSRSVCVAENDRALRRAMKIAGLDPARPRGTIGAEPPPHVSRERVVSWLAARKRWRHLDDRVTDLGWAYLVNTQPDDYLDGRCGLSHRAGPLVVAKNGAVWALPWSPETVPALAARDEPTFHRLMFAAGHRLNRNDPDEWLP